MRPYLSVVVEKFLSALSESAGELNPVVVLDWEAVRLMDCQELGSSKHGVV